MISTTAITGRSAWPIPTGRPLAARTGIAIALLAAFAGLLPWLRADRFALARTLPAACILLVGTTCLQGYDRGFIMPTQALENRTQQYFDDAVKIESARQFLGAYNASQTSLTNHAQTHPPGAVLAYYFLFKLLRQPALISIAIGIFSLAAGMAGVYGLVRQDFGAPRAGCAAFLYALLPSVQIYSLASLDALIAAFFILTVACYFAENRWLAYAGTAFCLVCAMMLSYAFLFLPAVLLAYGALARKSLRRFAGAGLALAASVVALSVLFKFNYLEGFRTASRIENPGGFMLIATPLSYAATRVENVCEILLFLGPAACWLMFSGLAEGGGARTKLTALSRIAIATLLLMFLTGAFRTGETARSCLFITPFLIFPITARIDRTAPGLTASRVETSILACVFAQTVFMQFVGFYFW